MCQQMVGLAGVEKDQNTLSVRAGCEGKHSKHVAARSALIVQVGKHASRRSDHQDAVGCAVNETGYASRNRLIGKAPR